MLLNLNYCHKAIGGNIMTGSPISDMNPILMAAGIKLNVCSLERGFRSVMMDDKFFVGYRRNIIAPDEVLLSIEIPYSTPVSIGLFSSILNILIDK